ncbi:MAG: insulinase family protein [Pirellulaceae bacterium]
MYQNQLSAANAEVAIVGEFEMNEAISALSQALDNWQTDVEYGDTSREVNPDAKGDKMNIVTPDKANAVFTAGLSFAMNDDDADTAALELGNFILGGGTLSSRLGNRIRQQEGLSYGVTSSISIPDEGNDARFTINAITNPLNIDAVETAAMEELTRFINDGPTAEEVADAQSAWLESQSRS